MSAVAAIIQQTSMAYWLFVFVPLLAMILNGLESRKRRSHNRIRRGR